MIASLNAEGRELSAQEQTMLWAYKTLDEYNNLPKGNNRERTRVKFFLKEASNFLIQNPQKIETAASIWKSRSDKDRSGLYEAIKIACGQQASEKWNEITSAQLTEIIKVHARSHLITDFTSSLLRGYFRGPEGLKDRVESLYKFVYGLIDVAPDEKALREGLKIARFESDILPKDSSFKIDIDIAETNLVADEILIKAISINNTVMGLSQLIYPAENIRDFMKFDSARVETRMAGYAKKAIRRESKESLLRKSNLLQQLYTKGSGSMSEKDTEEFSKTWIGHITLVNDPLRKKFNREVAYLVSDKERRKGVYEEAKKRREDRIPFSLKTPDGYVLNLYLPDSIPIDQWRDFIKAALEKANLSESDKLFMEDDRHFSEFNTGFVHNGAEVWAFVRKSGITELNTHQLSGLGEIGIPFTHNRNNQELADEILSSQIRFLNKRGVRVPLGGQLKEMSYAHIDFHKDADSNGILARVFVADRPYTVKLDRYLNLDLEGKKLDNAALAESLRYVFLSLLRPILCEERIKDPHLPQVSDEEREIISRMGHLRWLPQGQRFSKAAVENYLRLEQKDLFVTNLQRMEEHPNKGETTYVKPVIEKEENLPPITIHLPGVLRFN